jgi:hypothetical protein
MKQAELCCCLLVGRRGFPVFCCAERVKCGNNREINLDVTVVNNPGWGTKWGIVFLNGILKYTLNILTIVTLSVVNFSSLLACIHWSWIDTPYTNFQNVSWFTSTDRIQLHSSFFKLSTILSVQQTNPVNRRTFVMIPLIITKTSCRCKTQRRWRIYHYA